MAKTVRLQAPVRQKLQELPVALAKDWGLSATQESVVAALVHEVTPGQAAGMLMAYTRWLAARDAAAREPSGGDPHVEDPLD